MDVPRELELKLAVEPAVARRLRAGRAPPLRKDEAARKRLTSAYFDTKAFLLQRRGFSLRVRDEDGRRLQTLKSDSGRGAGVFDRMEWEAEIEGDAPDLSLLQQNPLRPALPVKRLRDRLRPLFRTEIERTAWRVRSDSAVIEVALDEGQVIAGEKTESFAELELELKSGAPSELFNLARALVPEDARRLGVLAKSDRGYALVQNETPAAFKAEPVRLEPDAPTADAFRTIIRACIRHFRLNERLVLDTRGVEPLHQCRVAMRRLRTALSVFKEVVADDEVEGLKVRLRALSQQLGEARDLDVFLAKLQQPDHAALEGEPNQAEVVERVGKDRDKAYDRVIATLRRKRFRSLMFDVLAWSEAGPWLASDDPAARARRARPIERFAAAELKRRRRKIRKRGRRLAKMNPPARHDVRIAAKKLRYASEFFSSLAKGKKNQKRREGFAKALEQLQEHLGDLNDLATRDKIVRETSRHAGKPAERGARSGGPVGPPSGTGREVKRSLAAATSAFREFADAKPFWPSGPGKSARKP